ncbi:16822_t:CDS:2, partial [Cetraspora pellucida]
NDGEITVNTIVNEHNHELSIESIQFQQDKIFNQDILDDIKFMTEHCNMGATAQRKFLEGKYPLQLIYSKDLYGMGLSLFVGFDNNCQNILLAQGLLIDETHESYVWLFNEIVKATGIEPAVILTDSNPAVDSAVKEVFKSTYPIHCAFHITQNLHKNLRKSLDTQYNQFLMDFYKCQNSLVKTTFENKFTKLGHDYPRAKPYLDNLYKSKEYWAYSYTSFKFTRGMIATSRVEATNDDIMINIEEENPKDQHATIQQMLEVVETFITADKYESEEAPDYDIPYLSPFCNQEKDFLQENLSLLEQKLVYKTLHSIYKKAISKALQSKSESDHLLKLLEDFV